MNLNIRASIIIENRFEDLAIRARVFEIEDGGRLIDCGVNAPGGFAAGIDLARICMGGLGEVVIVPAPLGDSVIPHVQVTTDAPVAACLASQYAGWALKHEKFFAMGSGPMRVAAGREPIFEKIGMRENAMAVVGVLEGRKLPPAGIFVKIAEACGVEPANVTLLIAPTASVAGGIQIVARSVETALHKLAEIGFDLSRIVAAHGIAPIAPVAQNDLAAIGRTNDAILYGARVRLLVRGDDAAIEEFGPKTPSCASPDYGEPFSVLFERYDRDFYKVDPLLFSPAAVTFENIDTGKSFTYGEVEPAIVARSFRG